MNCVQIDDKYLLSGANDAKVLKTDINTGFLIICSFSYLHKSWYIFIYLGQVVQDFQGHHEWIWGLQYCPSLLITCSVGMCLLLCSLSLSISNLLYMLWWESTYVLFYPDNRVKVWNAVSGESICTLRRHTAEVAGLHANFQTNKFLSSSFDGTVLYLFYYPLFILLFWSACYILGLEAVERALVEIYSWRKMH